MAFATPTDLETLLDRTLTPVTQVEDLLDAATAFLRNTIGGQHIHPPDTVTVPFKHRVCDRWIELPQRPVTAVDAVTVNGNTLDDNLWELVDGQIFLHHVASAANSLWADVEVTFTYGYTAVPEDLKHHCLLLASQMLNAVESTGSPSTSGVQSKTEQLDDWSESTTFETGPGATVSFQLPARIEQKLRAKYGGDTVVSVGSRWP